MSRMKGDEVRLLAAMKAGGRPDAASDRHDYLLRKWQRLGWYDPHRGELTERGRTINTENIEPDGIIQGQDEPDVECGAGCADD